MKYPMIVKMFLASLLVIISSCERSSTDLTPTLATLRHDLAEKFIGHDGVKKLCEKHLGMRYLLLPEIKIDALKGRSEKDLINPADFVSTDVDLNNKVAKSHIADMYVKFISDDLGYGVFAQSDIKSGDLVAEYTGVIDDLSNIDDTTWTWSYPTNEYKSEQKLPSIAIDGKLAGNILRFVNHSDNPNTYVKRIFLQGYFRTLYMAKKDIKANEQVTISYGSAYWNSRSKRAL